MSRQPKKLDISVGANISHLKKNLNRGKQEVSGFSLAVSKITAGVAIGNIISDSFFSGLDLAKTALSDAFTIAMDIEQTEIQFATLLKSGEKAKQMISDLQRTAASTPFQMPQISDTAVSMINGGYAMESVIPQMRMLGDVAAGLKIPLDELGKAYSKMAVSGKDSKIMNDDINILQDRGIPVYKELAKVLGTVPGRIKKMAETGQIEFQHIEMMFKNLTTSGKAMVDEFPDLGDLFKTTNQFGDLGSVNLGQELEALEKKGVPVFDALSSATGRTVEQVKALAATGGITGKQLTKAFNESSGEAGQFYRMMEAQSRSMSGLMSTLTDNINLQLGEVGQALFDAFDAKAVVESMISTIQSLGNSMQTLLETAKEVGPLLKQNFRVGSAAADQAGKSIINVSGALRELATGALGAFGIFGNFKLTSRDFSFALGKIEFGIKNLGKIFQSFTLGVTLDFVSMTNDLIHRAMYVHDTIFEVMKKGPFAEIESMPERVAGAFEKNLSNLKSKLDLELAIGAEMSGVANVKEAFGQTDNKEKTQGERLAFDIGRAIGDVVGGDDPTLTMSYNPIVRKTLGLFDMAIDKINEKLDPALPPEFGNAKVSKVKEPEIKLTNESQLGLGFENPFNLDKRIETPQFASVADAGTQEARDAILASRGIDFGKDKDKELLKINSSQE